MRACEELAGRRPKACPWNAFRDPFVGRVLTAYRWFKEGQFATRFPRPSHRLILALDYYAQTLDQVDAQREAERRKQQERESRR